MQATLKTFNFYRSYRLKITPEDDLGVRLRIILENEQEICPRGKSQVVDINYHYLSVFSEAELKKGDQLSIKLSLKRFLSNWDIYLKGSVVRSFCERKGYIYGIEIEDNLELKYFLKEFVSRFSQQRLRRQMLESSIFEKRFNPRQGVEIYSMLIQFVGLFFQSKNTLNITQALREVARVLQAEEANIYLIRPDVDKLENVVTTTGTLKKDIDFREGIIGKVFTNEMTCNLLSSEHSDKTRSVVATPIRNQNNHCIGVLELRNSLHSFRFSHYHEKIIKMLGHIFCTYYSNYTPVSGSSVITSFNPKKSTKQAFLGQSQITLSLEKQFRKMKHSSQHVSLSGESGTGKTFLSKLIHNEGSMRPYPLTILDFEKDTYFELATLNWNTPGTVLLENIDLLKKTHHFHLAQRIKYGLKRVICTSKHSFHSLYSQHKISSSLYLLITQQYIHLPPLRTRKEDILAIAKQLLFIESEKRSLPTVPKFSQETENFINNYHWPQNLAELSQWVKKGLMSASEDVIDLQIENKDKASCDLVTQFLNHTDFSLSAKTIIEDFELALTHLKTKSDNDENAA